MSKKIVSALIAVLLATPVLASDYVINVHGIVCSFCAQGLTKKVSKLPFIDKSKYTKGVKVEIESQQVTIAVKSDDKLDVGTLFKAIESGGYEPIDIWTVNENGEPDELLQDQK